MKNLNKGLTLIELMVVVLILALISTIGLVAMNNARAKSRDAKRVYDIQQYAKALRIYAHENEEAYPNCASGCYLGRGGSLDNQLKPYLPSMPKDPQDFGGATINDNYYYYVQSNSCNGETYPTVHVQNIETPNQDYNQNLCPTGIDGSGSADYLVIIQ